MEFFRFLMTMHNFLTSYREILTEKVTHPTDKETQRIPNDWKCYVPPSEKNALIKKKGLFGNRHARFTS